MQLFRSFKISKLFGYKTVNIEFNSDIMILIGENGSGKTTIMNCINYVLKKQYDKLAEIQFEYIEIVWGKNGKKWIITHEELTAKRIGTVNIRERSVINQIQEKVKVGQFRKLINLVYADIDEDTKVENVFQFLLGKGVNSKYGKTLVYDCAYKIVDDIIAFNFANEVNEMSQYIVGDVLSLPTFRRIEKEFNLDKEKLERTLTGMHFGMSDVKELIENIRGKIDELNKKGFNQMIINLLGKYINPQPGGGGFYLQADKVEIVLKRLGDKLPDEIKNSITEYLVHQRHDIPFIESIVEELYKIYEQQESLDNCIKLFVEKCNAYLKNKAFVYKESEVSLTLISKESDDIIDLESLSSGEQQIISMLSQLYLRQTDEKFIVLVDEPELSLSIRWQEMLLPDLMKSGKCLFLLAVTHSPFIFNNELKQYAIGLHKFVEENG